MKKYLSLFVAVPILLSACKKDEDTGSTMSTPVSKSALNGVVQKGPFLNGSSIGVYELNKDFSPTGKVYPSEILDNSGTFELKNISLSSQYVQLKADGFYFNEVSGQNSAAPITLYALTDIADKSTINVNVLTHLDQGRVKYLLSTGLSFSAARKQAQQEIFKLFSIPVSEGASFDELTISAQGENNAKLLAVSIILQGFRTESELSDLLANISTDIRQDGALNSAAIGSLLINDARLFNLPEIRQHIENKYASIGMTVTIPDFEKYIKQFTDSTTYGYTNIISYPEFSNYGENVLFGDKTTFSGNLSMAANLPKGSSLKILIKGPFAVWAFRISPEGPLNWSVGLYNDTNQEQTITAESGKNCDLHFIMNSDTTAFTMEFYENGATVPSRVKRFNQ